MEKDRGFGTENMLHSRDTWGEDDKEEGRKVTTDEKSLSKKNLNTTFF